MQEPIWPLHFYVIFCRDVLGLFVLFKKMIKFGLGIYRVRHS